MALEMKKEEARRSITNCGGTSGAVAGDATAGDATVCGGFGSGGVLCDVFCGGMLKMILRRVWRGYRVESGFSGGDGRDEWRATRVVLR